MNTRCLVPVVAVLVTSAFAWAEDPTALVEKLRSEDRSERAEAARALIELGPPAVGPVSELLADERGQLREAAMVILINLGPASAPAVPKLLPFLEKKNQERIMGVIALGRIGPGATAAVDALLPLLKHDDPMLRAQASLALAKIGRKLEVVLPALVELLETSKGRELEVPIVAFTELGPAAAPAIPDVKALVRSDSERTRIGAIYTLSKIGVKQPKAILPTLEKVLLADPAWTVRCEAARRIGDLGGAGASAIPSIERAIQDKDVQVRKWCVNALEAIGEKGVPALTRALAHSDHVVRRDAAEGLGRLGAPLATPAVPALTKGLLGEAWDVRKKIVEALGRIGPASAPAAENLAKLLGEHGLAVPEETISGWDPQEFVRSVEEQTLITLARIGSGAKTALPALKAELQKSTGTRKVHAAWALASVGPSFGVARPALEAALESEDARSRTASARALAHLGKRAAASAKALQALRDAGKTVDSAWCAWALSEVTGNRAECARWLGERLSGEPKVAELSATLLGRLGPEAAPAVPALIEAIANFERDRFGVLMEAVGALGKIGAAAEPALKPLDFLQNHPAPAAAKSAAEASKSIRDALESR